MSKPRHKNHSHEARGRLAVVQAIVRSTRPDSAARDAAIAETVAKVTLLGVRGRQGAISERTLRGWIARYEAHGEAGLICDAPSIVRAPCVRLSRRWDAAMVAAGVDDVTITAIAEAVRGCIRAAWRVADGWRQVQFAVLPAASSLTRWAGVPLLDNLLLGPCMLPRQSIDRDAPTSRGAPRTRLRDFK
jgi:hypothetical protein